MLGITAPWYRTTFFKTLTLFFVGVALLIAPLQSLWGEPFEAAAQGVAQCDDGQDNDGDGLKDELDPDCHSDGKAENAWSYVQGDNDERGVPAAAQQAAAQTSKDNTSDYSPLCSLSGGALSSGSFVGCIATVIHIVFYKLPSYFAELMGKILDFFLGFTIDSNSYSGGTGEVIKKGWVVTRDIANIFFIVILIYTAIATIFNFSGFSYKTVVPAIIFNALLINFSLFLTKAAVDFSNITTHIFYNQIVVEDTNGNVRKDSSGSYTPLSEAIVAAYNPQRVMANTFAYFNDENHIANVIRNLHTALVNPALTEEQKRTIFNETNQQFAYKMAGKWNPWKENIEVGILDRQKVEAADTEAQVQAIVKDILANAQTIIDYQRETMTYATKFILISVIAGVLAFFTGLMFFRVAFVFLGRTVGLFIAMIFSPFAFMSRSIPKLSGLSTIGFDNWSKSLLSYLIVAPLFVFFLFIIYRFITSDFYSAVFPQGDTSFVGTVLTVCLPFMIIYGMLEAAKKAAIKYGGEFSEMIYNKVKGTAGLVGGLAGGAALGAVSGGLAVAGRGLFGGAARGIQQKTQLGQWLTRKQADKTVLGKIAQASNKGLNSLQTASYDTRNSLLMKGIKDMIKKSSGVELKTDSSKALNLLGLSTKDTAGGLRGEKKRQEEKVKKEVNNIDTNLTDESAKKNYETILYKEFSKTHTDVTKETWQRLSDTEHFDKEAKTDLEDKVKRGILGSFNEKDIKNLAKEKREAWEKENALLVASYNEFKEEDQKLHGEVKDNTTLTAALRLRYADKIRENPNTIWNTIRGLSSIGLSYAAGAVIPGAVGMRVDLDESRKQRAKAAEVVRKSIIVSQKDAQELVKLDKALNEALEQVAAIKPEFEEYKNVKGKFDHTLMDNETKIDMVYERRELLEKEIQTLDEDIRKAVVNSKEQKDLILKKQKAKRDNEKLKDIVKRRNDKQKRVDEKKEKEEKKKEDKK